MAPRFPRRVSPLRFKDSLSDEDVVRLSDARNVKTRREVQQYVSACIEFNYPEDLRVGAIVARKTLQVNFSYNHAKTELVRLLKQVYTPYYS